LHHSFSTVMRRLDPRIHRLAKEMDLPVLAAFEAARQ
jgi:hypothetical protein